MKAEFRSVLHHAQVAQRAGIVASENLKIAQHRGTLRYGTIRGGDYLPAVKQFEVVCVFEEARLG